MSASPDAELAEARAEWRRWVHARLPAAAASRPDWPVHLDHCFGRVILDAVFGRPWREAIPSPAWRHMDLPALRRASSLAAEIEDGRADLQALNRRSLRMRGEAKTIHLAQRGLR